MANKKKLSKYISLLLRHEPQKEEIIIDSAGWTDVNILISKLNITKELLEEIVAEDNKQRYSFSNDKSKIRANQGHSINVPDLDLKITEPPELLYHGTASKYVDSILDRGLLPQSRNYVHLSSDYNTAINVGSRHGSPTVLKVNAKKMHDNGFVFYLSANNVWLTNNVPKEYITL